MSVQQGERPALLYATEQVNHNAQSNQFIQLIQRAMEFADTYSGDPRWAGTKCFPLTTYQLPVCYSGDIDDPYDIAIKKLMAHYGPLRQQQTTYNMSWYFQIGVILYDTNYPRLIFKRSETNIYEGTVIENKLSDRMVTWSAVGTQQFGNPPSLQRFFFGR